MVGSCPSGRRPAGHEQRPEASPGSDIRSAATRPQIVGTSHRPQPTARGATRARPTGRLPVVTPAAVTTLLAAQCGVATRRQLLDAGLTGSAIAWRLRHGWRLVLPRVVAAQRGPLSTRQRLLAALLFGGEESSVTSMAAAAWHGVSAADVGARVHLLVGATRGLASTGFVVVRRTVRPDDFPWRRGPLTIASRPRSVGDAVRDSPSTDVARVVVLEAVQRRIVRVEDVRHELEAGPRQGSALLRGAVQAAESGAWSVPESDLAALCRRSRTLSEVWSNRSCSPPTARRCPPPTGGSTTWGSPSTCTRGSTTRGPRRGTTP